MLLAEDVIYWDRRHDYLVHKAKAWSPDGTKIAFCSGAHSRKSFYDVEHRLEIVDLDSGETTLVLEAEVIPLAWRP